MASATAADSLALKFGIAAPIAVAIALLLLSKLVTAKIQRVIQGQIALDSAAYGGALEDVPPHLRPTYINEYIEYSADAAQVVPVTFLPVVSAIFSLSGGVNRILVIVILVTTALAGVALDAWMLSMSAADYVSRKRRGYSFVTGFAILSNFASLILVLVYA